MVTWGTFSRYHYELEEAKLMTPLHKAAVIIYLDSIGKSNTYLARKYSCSVGRIQEILGMREEIRREITGELVDKYMKNIENQKLMK